MDSLVIGIDPSFTKTGLCLLYLTDEGYVLDLSNVGVKKEGHGFHEVFMASVKQAGNISLWIRERVIEFPIRHLSIVMEIPPPCAFYSAGLWMLDGLIARALMEMDAVVKWAPPNKIKSILGKRKAKKSESTALANDIIEIVDGGRGWASITSRGKVKTVEKLKMNSDEAEAFILAACHLSFPVPDYVKKKNWSV